MDHTTALISLACAFLSWFFFGERSDNFSIAGPELRSIQSSGCLVGIRRETLYEMSLTRIEPPFEDLGLEAELRPSEHEVVTF